VARLSSPAFLTANHATASVVRCRREPFLWRAELAGEPRSALLWRQVREHALRSFPKAYADEEQFVSSRTREEVSAELKIPYPGGNPWSSSYNMFQARSTATSEQIQGEYIMTRDSGSVYIMKAQGSLAPSSTGATGAPAR
jgi:hypothetical protein